MALSHAEENVLRLSREFAECAARCARLRQSEPYPHAEWSAAWEQRQRLVTDWMRAAEVLVAPTPTQEPQHDR